MAKRKGSKRKAKRRRNPLKFFLFILVILLLYLFTFKTDYFNIKSIETIGNDKMSREQIIGASMCNMGENIFSINKKKSRQSIEGLAYAKKASIKRKLPNKIIIEVIERQEIAAITYIGSYALVDDEGIILDITDQNQGGIPQISGLDLKDLFIGDNIFNEPGNVSIKNFIKYSDQMNILSLIRYINLIDNDIILELANGIKVDFGTADNTDYKLNFLIKILDDINEKGISAKQILLNKGENPVVVTESR